MKLLLIAAATLGLSVAAPAAAQTFSGACASTATLTQAACSTGTPTSADFGNTVQLNSTTDASLKVKVSAWQINQSTNAVTKAYLGDYGQGFGVTGAGDNGGAGNLHQIDNLGSYTDFIMLQFNKSVTLSGISEYLFQLNGVSGTHGDFAVANAVGLTPTVWNGTVDLTSQNGANFFWQNKTGPSGTGQTSGSTSLSGLGGSQVWLLSASQLSNSRDDGFKLLSINVTPQAAVPEPSTWAMLIFGFGAIGLLQRRRRDVATPAVA